MGLRAILMLVVAVVLGLSSVFMLKGWVERRGVSELVQTGPAMKPVVVARTPLNFGAPLRREDLHLADWPLASVPKESYSSIDDVLPTGQDRVVLYPISQGEPILGRNVSGLGGRATLSTLIDEDMRAVTIRVNDVLGVGGFVLPGDRVDVLLTQTSTNRETPTTDILLQNVRVLGIDQEANPQKDRPAVAQAVTLQVSPPQAQKLILAASVGTLSLALRNVGNGEEVMSRTVGLRDLKTGEVITPTVSAAPPRSSKTSIRVFRGVVESTMEVNRDDSRSQRGSP